MKLYAYALKYWYYFKLSLRVTLITLLVHCGSMAWLQTTQILHSWWSQAYTWGNHALKGPQAYASDLSSNPNPTPTQDLESLIRETALRHKLPPILLRALVKVESNDDPDALRFEAHLAPNNPNGFNLINNTSIGLTQIIPRFWLGKQNNQNEGICAGYGVTRWPDLLVPEKNLNCGAAILKYSLNMNNNNIIQALRAYNEGKNGTVGASEYTRKIIEQVGILALSY